MTREESFAVIDALNKWLYDKSDERPIDEVILGVTSAQPERKKGKWIDSNTTCSVCGWQMIDDVVQSPNRVWFNFCPNCGADMKGESNDLSTGTEFLSEHP